MFKNFFTNAYAMEVARQWEAFQRGGHISGVRPLILESWKRCRQSGVSARQATANPLPQEDFGRISANCAEFIDVAAPILERVYAAVKSYECQITLANADGVFLRVWESSGSMINMREGQRVTEKSAGTSGMPLCLRHRRPVLVYCAEHYCRSNHDTVCVSTPVIDHTGKMLGGVTISCHKDIFHPWSFTLVTEAGKSIAEQLRLRSLLSRENLLIESFSEGVLLLDEAGQIIRANSMATALLGLGPTAQTVEAVFPKFARMAQIKSGSAFKNEEATGGLGRQARCVLSFTPLEGGGLLTLKNIPEMYTYAARTAGIKASYVFEDIIGQSPPLLAAVQKARRYAESDLTVLIMGESGTGKELFAQAIHNASARRREPFVTVNCGALPRGLVQSELFGYAEGAFTGARRQGNPGKFELANGGTVFLDEIGEMELEAQSSLLRLLQSGEVCRIGGSSWQKVNVRVIAATNRDLPRAVAEGRFRADLYHRLNVCGLHIPPLRERTGDLALLIRFFLDGVAARYPQFRKHTFTDAAMECMEYLPWPGNVRELEHFIEKILFSVKGSVVDVQTIQAEMPLPIQAPTADEDEKAVIIAALQHCNGNVAQAAISLGIGKTKFYARANQYGVVPKNYRRLRPTAE